MYVTHTQTPHPHPHPHTATHPHLSQQSLSPTLFADTYLEKAAERGMGGVQDVELLPFTVRKWLGGAGEGLHILGVEM